jgi:ketosteroid isomerase-like protein
MEEARRDAGLKSDVDRLREINDVVTTGDIEAMSETLHPDVVWEHNLGVGSPEEGVYRGRENVVALFRRILEPWESMRSEPREVRARGNGVFDVRGELHAKHSTSTTEVISPYVQHFELSDGLLVKGQMVSSTDPAWQAGDIDVVRQVVDAFREHDVPRLRSLFDEQSEFRSAIVAIEGGVYRGLDEIERYMRDLEEAFEDWHSEDERYLDAGDGRVVLEYRIVGRGKGSGVPVDQPIAILWTVRDGKIVRAEGYLDPEGALEVASAE